ncbi:MAG: hypothetical protein HQK76_21230, partial [Desulfobacterales bacterium]|nr:hypothetical protein [Desulfobacterales bacterium]
TLGVTTDELLGKTKIKIDFNSTNTTLWRKLKVIENLPKIDQKAILHYIKMIAKSRGIDQKKNTKEDL